MLRALPELLAPCCLPCAETKGDAVWFVTRAGMGSALNRHCVCQLAAYSGPYVVVKALLCAGCHLSVQWFLLCLLSPETQASTGAE